MTQGDNLPAYVLAQQNQSSRGLWIGLFVVVVIGVVFLLREPLQRILEGEPTPYDPSMQPAFDGFMRESLPKYVVVVGRDDDATIAAEREKLIAAAGHHPEFQKRVVEVCDSIDKFRGFLQGATFKTREKLLDRLTPISDAVLRLEDTLRRANVPFTTDAQVNAYERQGQWRLSLVIRSSKVLMETKFRSGDDTVKVLRGQRIDNLSVKDLLHGKAQNGYAKIHVDGLRQLVYDRWLPVLRKGESLRDAKIDQHPYTSDETLSAEELRPALIATLPKDLQDEADRIGLIAAYRRLALEDVNAALSRYQSYLIPPKTFVLDEKVAEGLVVSLGEKRHPDEVTALRAVSEPNPKISLEERALIERAAEILFEHAARSVERHEAWHLLSPKPKTTEPSISPYAASETVAYLGAIADAGDELPLAADYFFRIQRRLESSGAEGATAEALRFIGLKITAVTDMQSLKAEARALLSSAFSETRSLEVVR